MTTANFRSPTRPTVVVRPANGARAGVARANASRTGRLDAGASSLLVRTITRMATHAIPRSARTAARTTRPRGVVGLSHRRRVVARGLSSLPCSPTSRSSSCVRVFAGRSVTLARSRRLPTRWLARCSAGYPPRGRSLACRAASTALADARSCRCSGEAAEGDPCLLARRERHSPFEDLERVRVDAAQEPPVDARHRGDAGAAAVVEKRQQPQTVLEPRRRPLGLEAHQPGDCVTRPAHIRTYAEAGAILRRQVHATHRPVLDYVTEDVR